MFYTHRRIKPPKDKSLTLVLKKNLTEGEAFKHEIYMIAILGRKDLGTGILRNLTNGGEGTSGNIHTEEWKQAHSERMSGRPGNCANRKAIIAIKPNGTERHFVSLTEAARELGFSDSNLSGRYLKPGYVSTRGKFKDWQFLFKNSEES